MEHRIDSPHSVLMGWHTEYKAAVNKVEETLGQKYEIGGSVEVNLGQVSQALVRQVAASFGNAGWKVEIRRNTIDDDKVVHDEFTLTFRAENL